MPEEKITSADRVQNIEKFFDGIIWLNEILSDDSLLEMEKAFKDIITSADIIRKAIAEIDYDNVPEENAEEANKLFYDEKIYPVMQAAVKGYDLVEHLEKLVKEINEVEFFSGQT